MADPIKPKLVSMINTLQEAIHSAGLVDDGQKSARTDVRKALLAAEDQSAAIKRSIRDMNLQDKEEAEKRNPKKK